MLKRAFLVPALPPSFLQTAKQREVFVNLINGYVLKVLVHMMGLIIALPAQLHYRESRAAWMLFLPSDEGQAQVALAAPAAASGNELCITAVHTSKAPGAAT